MIGMLLEFDISINNAMNCMVLYFCLVLSSGGVLIYYTFL